MDRAKILEAARENRGRGKEYENRESVRGSLLGLVVAFAISACLFLAELFVKSEINTSLITVIMAAMGVQSLYEGVRVKKFWLSAIGLVALLIATVAALAFIGGLIAV